MATLPTATATGWRVRLGAASGWIAALLGIGVLLLVPSIFDQYFGFSAGFELHRVSLIGIYVIAALAQNILTGYAAQPSLGNAAFFGISAYLLIWLVSDDHWPFWAGALVAVLACSVLGLVVGGPALRISGAYLAIATLGLVFVTGNLMSLWDKVASRQGYDFTNEPLALQDDHTLYILVLAFVTVCLAATFMLIRSRTGRAWIAIRDSEVAASASGIPVTRYKLTAFVVSAALTGLAGVLYATWATSASAGMSSTDQTIAFLTMIVVGGLGSLVGSVLGALFVGMLPLLLGQLPNTVAVGTAQIQISTLTSGIFGLLLLLVLIFFPNGLARLVDRAGQWGRSLWQRGGAR